MKHFASLKDHRHPSYITHPLTTIIGITLAALICGAKDWYEIEDYGKQKAAWLGQFLDLRNGTPSHDTFNLFFALTDPAALEQCFEAWVSQVALLAEGRIVCLDGKTLRGSSATKQTGTFTHMVSAWCATNQLVLAQQKVADKSNEITAIPLLLKLLVLKGCLVTIDAMGCQKEIAAKIIDKEADYLLAVKENHEFLYDDIREAFAHSKVAADSCHNSEVGHGRVESRVTSVLTDTDWLCGKAEWKNICCIIMVFSKCYDKKSGKEQSAVRYYISSRQAPAAYFHQAVRVHWGIENKLHWMLDVTFGEDHSTKRAGHAAQNFSLMTKVALNMITKHDGEQQRGGKMISARRKRMMAAWDNDYLIQILLSLKSTE